MYICCAGGRIGYGIMAHLYCRNFGGKRKKKHGESPLLDSYNGGRDPAHKEFAREGESRCLRIIQGCRFR